MFKQMDQGKGNKACKGFRQSCSCSTRGKRGGIIGTMQDRIGEKRKYSETNVKRGHFGEVQCLRGKTGGA